jgi:hypothetical protein
MLRATIDCQRQTMGGCEHDLKTVVFACPEIEKLLEHDDCCGETHIGFLTKVEQFNKGDKKMNDFKNDSGLEFLDISSEEWREYVFETKTIRIHAPQQLHVSKNGHRLFDDAGVSHYVPNGWVHLHWRARDGKPNFVK